MGAVTLFATQDYEHLFPRDFTVSLSENGVSWTTVASEQDFDAAAGANRWSFDGVTATQMKVEITDFGTIAGQMVAMIAEIELEETPPDPNRLNLRWLAVGDDGNSGTAHSYEVRYSQDSITPANFEAASLVSSPPSPKETGSGRRCSSPVFWLKHNITWPYA